MCSCTPRCAFKEHWLRFLVGKNQTYQIQRNAMKLLVLAGITLQSYNSQILVVMSLSRIFEKLPAGHNRTTIRRWQRRSHLACTCSHLAPLHCSHSTVHNSHWAQDVRLLLPAALTRVWTGRNANVGVGRNQVPISPVSLAGPKRGLVFAIAVAVNRDAG